MRRFASFKDKMKQSPFQPLLPALLTALTVSLLGGCSDPEQARQNQAPIADEAQLMALGQQKARVCASCHGPRGVSRVTAYPSLAGLSADYMQEQLLAFRSGARANPTMNSIAINLNDNDIRALALYYSSLETKGP